MRRITNVRGLKDPYVRRILSNIVGKDAFIVYSRTPPILQKLTHGLSASQLRRSAVKGKWSIAQIVSHLHDSELVMGFRYRMAIAQSGSRLQAFDEKKWADKLRYRSADCRKKLKLFVGMRRDHIDLLRDLTSKEWKRFGMHEERGKETVERMVQMLAGHDINHLRQIENIRKVLRSRGGRRMKKP